MVIGEFSLVLLAELLDDVAVITVDDDGEGLAHVAGSGSLEAISWS